MPEVRIRKENNAHHAAFWEITESEETLKNGLALSPEALNRLNCRKSEVHRKGYLAIRQLLKQMNIVPKTHQYDVLGAPYLTDGRFLSLSHTKTFAAVALSDTPVGIDIENYQDKIIRIAPRFLHSTEVPAQITSETVPFLTQIWTAKEAIYKALRIPGVHFSEQIEIHPFEVGASKGSACVYLNERTKEFHLHFLYFKNFCATIASFKNP